MHYSSNYDSFYDTGYRADYEGADTWPADAIKVTKAEWTKYGAGQPPAGMQRSADAEGRPTWVEVPPLPIDDLAAQATRRINAGYTAALSGILNQYPEAETLSFDKQEREARAWIEWQNIGGTEPATPYVDAMLVERPIGKAELIERIIDKADQFILAHGHATGRRQRLEDEVKAAQAAGDRAAIEAVEW